tara:strand:+ start:1141 stop:1311 length:171 start_codon:yes stop_codon:yes gene_type:complete
MMDDMKQTLQYLRSDIDTLMLEMRTLKEENRQLKSSLEIMAQRLANERNEPLIKWT